LLKATHEVLQGRRYLSADLAEILLNDFDKDSLSLHCLSDAVNLRSAP